MESSNSGPSAVNDGPSAGDPGDLEEQEREILRRVAWDSIRHGLSHGCPPGVPLGSYPAPLEERGAVFVTLKCHGRLRGCIGSYEARRPLIEDVSENAFAAAFLDPRFPALDVSEMDGLTMHISVLTPPAPLEVGDRSELLATLRPGVDGLLLEDPPHRATFLPQVWEALPSPDDFLDELFQKGGLPRNHWSPTLRFHRYTVREI